MRQENPSSEFYFLWFSFSFGRRCVPAGQKQPRTVFQPTCLKPVACRSCLFESVTIITWISALFNEIFFYAHTDLATCYNFSVFPCCASLPHTKTGSGSAQSKGRCLRIAFYFLRHVLRLNSTRMGKISKRPASISMISTSLESTLKEA